MCIRMKVKENNNCCACSWRGREAVDPVDQSRHHSIRIHEVPRRSRKRTDIHIMDCGLMFVNFDLIDSMGVKEEPLPENIPSSYGSPVSLDSPPSEDMRKRPLEIEDAVRPDKKLRLGRKTKNSGLRYRSGPLADAHCESQNSLLLLRSWMPCLREISC